MDDGTAAGSVALVGVAGSGIWPEFASSPEYRDGLPDPLDRWSRRIGGQVATELGAQPVFPFDGPPYHPFLGWAVMSGPVWPSRLGIHIHSEYGLWHAFRFALLFRQPLADLPAPDTDVRPCDRCATSPCLSACPADAFSDGGYDVERCYRFLDSNPVARCHTEGCLARGSCPVGAGYRYIPEHAAFHMAAFLRAQARRFGDNEPHSPRS